MANLDLGFVGVGRMGGLMAPRLLDKGYTVTVFDKNASAVEKLRELGAIAASSAEEVADAADIVILVCPPRTSCKTSRRERLPKASG